MKKTMTGFKWAVLVLAFMLLAAGCGKTTQEQQRSALHHFKRGNEAFRVEEYNRAIRHFETAVELDYQSPDLHYNLGLAFYVTGNYNASVLSLQEALALDPSLPDAHYNLALAYDKLYNAAAAHAHYNTYRNMIAGRIKGAAKARGNPLPPPPNSAGGKRRAVDQARRQLAQSSSGGAGKAAAAAAAAAAIAGKKTGVPAGAASTQPLRGKRIAPPYRSAGNRAVSQGMPKGVRQKLPMAKPRPSGRPGSRQPGNGTNSRSAQTPGQTKSTDKPMLGGSEKWWIQDRFIPQW